MVRTSTTALWRPEWGADLLANSTCSLNWRNQAIEQQVLERAEQEAEEDAGEGGGDGPERAEQVLHQQELEAAQLVRDVDDILQNP